MKEKKLRILLELNERSRSCKYHTHRAAHLLALCHLSYQTGTYDFTVSRSAVNSEH